MILTDIGDGSEVFVDANVLIDFFAPDPVFGPPCRSFIERIVRGEIVGWTTTHVLSDIAHRLMALEAISRFSWPAKGIAHRLAAHPQEVQQLSSFRTAVELVPQLGIQIAAIIPSMPAQAAVISQQFGLLSGDALVVAFMQQEGITQLASHDADFDRVPNITRYEPA